MFIVKLIKALLVIFIFLAAFFPVYINISAFAAKTQDYLDQPKFTTDSKLAEEIFMPNVVAHEGVIYRRDSYWKEYEEMVYADIDGDAIDELIVRFRAGGEDAPPVAVTVIYGANKGDKTIAKVILGEETPKSMELFDIDKDGVKDLILYDHAGNHYTVIMIYSFKDNDYKCLFENGTACYVHEVDTKLDPVRITIGRENWEKEGFCYAVSGTESLLEVWEWNGEKFMYSPSLSTTPPLTEKEAIEITWQNMKKNMKEMKKESEVSEENLSDTDVEFMAKSWIAGIRAFQLFKDKKEFKK